MHIPKPFQYIVGFVVLSSIAFLIPNRIWAQNIYSTGSSSNIQVFTTGGIGMTNGASGPVFSVGASLNGKTDLGVTYARTNNEEYYSESFAVFAGFLVNPGDALHFEFSPKFQKTTSRSDYDLTFFTMETAISGNLTNEGAALNLVPRLSLSYTNIITSETTTSYSSFYRNFLLIGGTVDLTTYLTDGLLLRLGGGLSYNLKDAIQASVINSGPILTL